MTSFASPSPSNVVDLLPWQSSLGDLRDACRCSPEQHVHEFFEDAEQAFHRFPKPVHQALTSLRRGRCNEGFVLLRGLPVDRPLVPTPLDSRRPTAKKTWVSEFWLAAVSHGLGEVFAYKDQTSGELFHNVAPTPEAIDDAYNAECSRAELTFHTDGYGHPLVPDYVALFCLRGAYATGTARTLIAPLSKLLPRLPPRTVELLHQPHFRIPTDTEFRFPVKYLGTLPLLQRTALGSQLTYFDDTIEGVSDQAQRTLDEVVACAHDSCTAIELCPGDLIVIDNRGAIHARTPFEARLDGTDRWLQTAYIKQDLRAAPANVCVRDHIAEVTSWPKEA